METEVNGVKVQFINRNIKLTDYLKDYFLERFEKLTSKIPEGLKENAKAYFIYKKEGDMRTGELIITIAKKNISPLYASDEKEDPRTLIDSIAQEVEKQIEKIRTEFEKQIREEKKTKREIHGEPEEEKEEDREKEKEEELKIEEKQKQKETETETDIDSSIAGEPEIEVVRLSLEKPLTVDDAVFMLEEMEKKKGSKKFPIYVFTDYDGKVKILYRKKEGKYTLFEVG